MLGEFSGIEAGQQVTRTGEVLSVAVGDGYLGRVVDPLGNPIDGLGAVATEGRRALELQAPGVMQRKSVHEPMQTGIKAIDAMIPVGRGQRQLIIGDRQTGKTAIAIDTIINQKANWESGDVDKQVRCIYVAIGQKGSTIAAVKGALEDAGAMEYTTIVAAPASDPAGFKYLAPYTGSAIGQHWMYDGKHVLIIFDDLTKQAEAYRAVSLLLRRPPGREAYPGDVFYLHSRLLERCAKLSDELGAGSMTGLPIIETKANDVSAYIPTNVISITDGQIFLQSDLFNSNQRPAVDVGISVSRVGGDAQVKSIKKVSGTLKLELAQYRSLEAFAMFASDLDAASRRQLSRGARLTELLKQPQYSPYPVEEQVVSIWAGTNGKLDSIEVEDVLPFERELLDYLRRNTTILDTLRDTNVLDDDTAAELAKKTDEFILEFRAGKGQSIDHAGPRGVRGRRRRRREPGEDRQGSPLRRNRTATMGAQLRVYKQKINTAQTTKKITKAMELIAASRIQKAMARVRASSPFARAVTRAVSAVATHSNVEHPLTREREVDPPLGRRDLRLRPRARRAPSTRRSSARASSSPSCCAGRARSRCSTSSAARPSASSSSVASQSAAEWTGDTDTPHFHTAEEIAATLLDAYNRGGDDGGVDEIHLVYNRFVSMMTQTPETVRLLPLEVVEAETAESATVYPLYEFEPDAETVLDALLPVYIQSRVFNALLQSSAAKHAATQKAMKSASDNADKLITDYTRLRNNARQAEITQQIAEIVGGADALSSGK